MLPARYAPALAPGFASGPVALAPSGARARGVWVGVPSRPGGALPARCSAAPGGGGWVAPFVRCSVLCLFGGVLCLFLRRCRLLWFVPPGSCSPLGAVAPWAFRSARPPGLSRRLSRSSASLRPSPPPGLPLPGRPGSARLAGGVAFARCRLRLALRPRGRSPFPLRRRPRWSVAVAPRAPWPPCSPLAVAFRLRWALRVASLPLLSPAPVVGFSGGRRLSPAFRPQVVGVVSAVVAAGRSVAVGCAGGLDLFVRSAAPGALVFSVVGPRGQRLAAAVFAARSVRLVRAVAAGGPGSGFVVFPAAPCPAGLAPSSLPLACFCGSGSGSWASAAFAAGLGLPLVVFPCGFSALPAWGLWSPAGAGVWSGGFRLAVA
jgi:hypothetical protein